MKNKIILSFISIQRFIFQQKQEIKRKEKGAEIVFFMFALGLGIFAVYMVLGGWKFFRDLFQQVVNGE